MKCTRALFGLFSLALLVTAAWSDHLPPVPSPLLYVRVQGPQGLRITFLEGPQLQRTFDAPVTVGLRPGFGYRLKVEGFADQPHVAIYASIEVGDTLRLPRRAKSADHPAPVLLTEEDFRAVLTGTMVKKIVVVENPDKVQTVPGADQPAEVNVLPGEPLMERAADLGRPLAIVYIGRREPDPTELAQQFPGNVLYPGMACLPPMRHAAFPFRAYGRLEECMRDGGDNGERAYFDGQGTLHGVDPSDTVSFYRDSTGMPHLAITNEVCLCVPRFVVARQLIPLLVAVGLNGAEARKRLDLVDRFDRSEKGRLTRQVEEAETKRHRQKPQANISEEGPRRIVDMQMLLRTQMNLGPADFLGTDKLIQLTELDKAKLKRQIELAIRLSSKQGAEGLDTLEGTKAVGRVVGLGTVVGKMETRTVTFLCPPEKPTAPDQPLHIIKWVNTESARIGDVVTFHIKYTNLGGRPITDIAVVDSLTHRLEYVPGSAKSDREAVFVMQDNDAGSLMLRWEIKNPLPPGQSGVVSFEAKVK
jgi:uncharacterized repeat protein (TIGR01451 family)